MSVEVTGPAQVPDLRLHMLDRWRENGLWDRATVTERFAMPWPNENLRPERHWHLKHLREADLWYVSPQLVDVVLAMAKLLPRDVRPHELEVEWPIGELAGLVVFGRPIVGTDSRIPDHKVRVSAILFGPTLMAANPTIGRMHEEACVSVSSYSFHRWEDGLGPDELAMAAELGEMPRVVNPKRNGASWGGMGVGSFWMPMGRSDWPLSDPLGAPIDSAPLETYHETLSASAEEDRRLLAALLMVASQPRMAERVTHRPDKGTARRSKRANVESEVVVVSLRRPPNLDHEPTGERREWQHCWMVQAHQRWQPCGPGRTQRKRIIVTPHMKGDLSKPFIGPRPTVKALVR